MPKIILLAGKMQSGKTTTANYIVDKMNALGNYSYKIGFADALKHFCIENKWMTKDQAYGSQEDKNSLTNLNWEDMPGNFNMSGKMTVREVLQYVGTNIFRRIDNNFWVRKTLEQLLLESDETLVVIDDARFPNEVLEMKQIGAITIYLTRNLYNNQHASEVELDDFDKSNFNYIIDNQKYDLVELDDAIREIIRKENNFFNLIERKIIC